MNNALRLMLPVSLLLSACGTANSYLANRTTTVEMYHIFDVKTTAPTSDIIRAAANGLAQNTGDIQQLTPVQLGKVVPVEPGRFVLNDVGAKLSESGGMMGALFQMGAMQQGGMSLKSPKCDDAVWTSRAERVVHNSNKLTLYSCLYKYQAGYQLDTYAVFNKTEGSLMQISRDLAYSLTGTPEQWVNKTIIDTVRSIESATGAKVAHVEGQPELSGFPQGVVIGKLE